VVLSPGNNDLIWKSRLWSSELGLIVSCLFNSSGWPAADFLAINIRNVN